MRYPLFDMQSKEQIPLERAFAGAANGWSNGSPMQANRTGHLSDALCLLTLTCLLLLGSRLSLCLRISKANESGGTHAWAQTNPLRHIESDQVVLSQVGVGSAHLLVSLSLSTDLCKAAAVALACHVPAE